MLSRIITNTPIWVWGLFLALLVLGITQARSRNVGLRRVFILPLVMTGLSVSGTVSTFGSAPMVLLAWAVATCLVVWPVIRRPAPALTRYDAATGLFYLPGSWIPMALILGIFSIKYVVGVTLAIQPALVASTGFANTIGALYGAMSGLFVGRAVRLWRIYKHPELALIATKATNAGASPIRKMIRIVIGGIAACVCAVAALIVFGTANPPPPLTAVTKAVMGADYRELPRLDYFAARDGSALAYRSYRTETDDRIAVLVHGSSADSHAMHAVGLALKKSGITAYALDIRGHGASGRKGDVDYVGQLDDDLADFVAKLRSEHPQAQLTMIGHSSGGGFVLRTAGGRNRDLFDRYLLLAPFLHQDAPTTRRNAGGWVQPFVLRMFGLSILDRLGLPWFQNLPVLAFALPPEATSKATTTYSYRLQSSFRPHDDYLGDVRAITKPTRVLVGANDELFIADQYAPLLEPMQPKLSVKVLPDISHIDIVMKPAALAAIVTEL